jgi:hypothetical protein
MTDAAFLDGYTGQTTEGLLALEGPYRADSIVLAFEQAIEQKADRIGESALTDAERTVLAVEALERDVNNDGFIGLFTYRAEVVPRLVEALQAIGRDDVATLAQRAIDVLGIDVVTPEAVVAAVAEDDEVRDERLNTIDEAYYATAGDLAGPLLAYIRAHREEIVIPG